MIPKDHPYAPPKNFGLHYAMHNLALKMGMSSARALVEWWINQPGEQTYKDFCRWLSKNRIYYTEDWVSRKCAEIMGDHAPSRGDNPTNARRWDLRAKSLGFESITDLLDNWPSTDWELAETLRMSRTAIQDIRGKHGIPNPRTSYKLDPGRRGKVRRPEYRKIQISEHMTCGNSESLWAESS